MEILAGRGVCEGDHKEHHHLHYSPPPASSSSSSSPTPLGQVIDLLPPPPPPSTDESTDTTTTTPQTPSESITRLQATLKNMDLPSLLRAFQHAQEERAQTYTTFDNGLATILETGKFNEYDALCAETTANFAALSNLVNAVEKCVVEAPHEKVGLGKLLRQVQGEEKEKLSLTAALHLEKVRLMTSTSGSTSGGNGGGSVGESENKSVTLLREGVKRLEGKINEVKARINELLEEVRYELEEE